MASAPFEAIKNAGVGAQAVVLLFTADAPTSIWALLCLSGGKYTEHQFVVWRTYEGDAGEVMSACYLRDIKFYDDAAQMFERRSVLDTDVLLACWPGMDMFGRLNGSGLPVRIAIDVITPSGAHVGIAYHMVTAAKQRCWTARDPEDAHVLKKDWAHLNLL